MKNELHIIICFICVDRTLFIYIIPCKHTLHMYITIRLFLILSKKTTIKINNCTNKKILAFIFNNLIEFYKYTFEELFL